MTRSGGLVGAYIRPSTEQQNDQHQRDSINEYIEQSELPSNQVKQFVDIKSGSDDEREQFQELLDGIRSGDISDVVVWEISRISRDGATLQKFFDTCEEHHVTIHISDGAIDKVEPDGGGRFLADVIGMVYQQERRQLIRRVEAGVRRAKDEGKRLGRVPAGFRRDENGYLQPIIEPGEDEDSYFEIADALERIDAGSSYRSVAGTLSISRQGLSKIHQNPDRKRWYIDGESDDNRVAAALDRVDSKN